MTMDAEVREAVKKYVQSNNNANWRPTLVRAEQTSPSASLDVDIEQGSLFLGLEDDRYRVVFEKDDHSSPQLAPGKYQLLGYQIRRQADDGKQWFVSTCGIKNRSLDVTRKPTEHTIDPAVYVAVEAESTDTLVKIQLNIQCNAGSAITIYRDGKRVPALYELRDADGVMVVSGSMDYG